jgi:hypothetical protein
MTMVLQDEHHAVDGQYDTSGWIIDQSEFSSKAASAPKKSNLSFGFKSSQSSQSGGVEETKGDDIRAAVSVDPMRASSSGQMEDATPLSDRDSQTSFKEFFGTTSKAAPPGGYQPTSRSSGSAKDQQPLMMSEV